MNRLRPALLLPLALAGCGPQAPAPAEASNTLAGVVEDSASGKGLAGASVLLTGDTLPSWGAPPPGFRYASTDASGRFVLRDVEPGSYVLHARCIGCRARWLRVAVPAVDRKPLTLRMQLIVLRFGWYPPDSAEVAKNRERMSEWTCRTSDSDVIEATRKAWVENFSSRELASWDSTLDSLGIPRDNAEVARLVRHVTDPEVCRRAGHAYDRMIGATDIYFLVFEVGPVLIVADGPGDATLMLDREYRVITAFIVP